jgi:hypothetical protein
LKILIAQNNVISFPGSNKEKKKKNPNIRAPDSKPKSIKSMFAAAAVKPKKKQEVTKY